MHVELTPIAIETLRARYLSSDESPEQMLKRVALVISSGRQMMRKGSIGIRSSMK